jgi:hypothetical protein
VRIAGQIVGLTLLLAAVAKVRRSDIVADVAAYQIVPTAVLPLAAYGLLVAEGVIGLGLVAGAATPIVSLAALLLMATFAGSVAWNVMRKANFACGCFGSGASEPISLFVFARALILLVLSAYVFVHASELRLGEFVTAIEATIVAGSLVLLRLLGLVPLALSFIRAPVSIAPMPTRRMGFRHVPIDSSLFATMRTPHLDMAPSLEIPLVQSDEWRRG